MSSMHGTETTAGPIPGPVAPQDTGATGGVGGNPEAMAAVTRRARELLPVHAVVTDHTQLRTYECDGLTNYRVTPALVVMPESTEQLAAVVRACAEHHVPFVARGSGTGLSGGALPRADGVLVVTSRRCGATTSARSWSRA
jgi:glycolate oxidase